MDYGPAFDEAKDGVRLFKQRDMILQHMLNGSWQTLGEIEIALNYPQASISAQLRHLRKKDHGGYIVDKRRRGKGTWEYQVTENDPPKTVADIDSMLDPFKEWRKNDQVENS